MDLSEKRRQYQREYQKNYRLKTREYQKEYQKKYREENKINPKEPNDKPKRGYPYYKKYLLNYYYKNKDKILEYSCKDIPCACGRTYKRKDKVRHLKSKLHIKRVNDLYLDLLKCFNV